MNPGVLTGARIFFAQNSTRVLMGGLGRGATLHESLERVYEAQDIATGWKNVENDCVRPFNGIDNDVLPHGIAAQARPQVIADTADSSDAWTVGFTPQVSVASWAGSNTLAPIYNNAGTSMYGRQNPGKAWQLFMNALRSSPFLPVADALHAVIFCCWVIGAEAATGVDARQSFMNALRSSPVLPAADALQVVIFDC